MSNVLDHIEVTRVTVHGFRSSLAAPVLDKPFWRFRVDAAEPDGQHDLLLKAENDGAEAYYVSPRFTSWDKYTLAFEGEKVLLQSLRPSEIANKLTVQGAAERLASSNRADAGRRHEQSCRQIGADLSQEGRAIACSP